jgi:hypothetical protein
MSPQRIQRRRTKGWRMPENTVYVGRGSKWGNPWIAGKVYILTGPKAGKYADRADVVRMFRNTLRMRNAGPAIEQIRAELAGKNLACWFPLVDENGKKVPCHADVLLRVANGGAA